MGWVSSRRNPEKRRTSEKKEEGPSGIAHGCDSISLYGIVSQLKER